MVGLGGDSEAAFTLRATFVALYVDLVLAGDEATANRLFEALAEASTRAIAVAIEQGILPATEMRDDARHRTLLGELQQIKRTLALLTAAGTVDSFNKFALSYREQASHRFGLLNLHHLDAPRRVPLDSVYVPPPFRRASEPHKLIELPDLLAGVYRLVVLGNPGGGKSTLAAKLCFSASKEYDSAPVGGRRLTPILLVLRNYGRGASNKGKHRSSSSLKTPACCKYRSYRERWSTCCLPEECWWYSTALTN